MENITNDITNDIKSELTQIIEEQSTTMSDYQITNFVLNDKMTNYKILKQIILEVGTRYTGLENLEIEHDIQVLELKKLERKYNNESNDLERQIIELEIKKHKLIIKSTEKTLKNYKYELDILEREYQNLKKELGNFQEIKKLLDDPKGEELYFINKFIKEAQIDIMTGGRVGKGVLDAILMLPEDQQKLIINNAVKNATDTNIFISNSENKSIEEAKKNFVNGKIKLSLNNIVKD